RGPRVPVARDRGHRRRPRASGHHGRACGEGERRTRQHRGADTRRSGRSRDQHAVRTRPSVRWVGDPHGVGCGERPLHHDAAGGLRGRARDRSARRGTHRAAVHPGASRGGLPRAVAGAALVRGIGRCDGGSGGVKRARAEILSTRRLGAYQSLTLVAPEIAERARPGQFVAAAMAEDRNFLLRRHLTIHQSSRRGGWAGTLEFVVEPGAGPGTTWLSELRAHGSIDIIGPLGKAFSYPKRLTNCLLVGHGRSVAGLYFLGQELVARGKRVDMVIGGSTMDTVFKPIAA